MNPIISQIIDLVATNESLTLENKNLKEQLSAKKSVDVAEEVPTSADMLLRKLGAESVVDDLRCDLPSVWDSANSKPFSFEDWYKMLKGKASELIPYGEVERLILNNKVTVVELLDAIKDTLIAKYATLVDKAIKDAQPKEGEQK